MTPASSIESELVNAAEMAGDYQSPDFSDLWKAITMTLSEIRARDAEIERLRSGLSGMRTSVEGMHPQGSGIRGHVLAAIDAISRRG